MRRSSSKNSWLSALYTVATLYVGTCIGAFLFIALSK